MPRPDPIPSTRLSALRTFRWVMKLVALFAIGVAAIAVLLVTTGNKGPHIYTLVATALGAGLIVLLAGALMSLVFLKARSGHDADAIRIEKEDTQ